jgi:hypothetical protein
VELADDFDQHRAQLSDALAERYERARIGAFVHRFVRPHGLAVPVAPIVADAIEGLARGERDGRSRSKPAMVTG